MFVDIETKGLVWVGGGGASKISTTPSACHRLLALDGNIVVQVMSEDIIQQEGGEWMV